MTTTAADGHSEMEGGGYYNAHSRPQASASELGIPLLQRAAKEVPLSGDLIAIADLGAAQGKNSLEPMAAVIAELRARSADTPIAVTHTDIPSNDFNSLFQLLATPQSYLNGTRNVYAYAAGVSFYERIFPANSQRIGWNSIAVHWLSAVPCAIPDHIWSPYAQGAVREAFRKRAAEDWNNFLSARAVEFRQGGEIVVVASSANDGGFAGAEGLMNIANEELRAMVRRRVITGDQYDKMAIPTYYRTRAEFEASFTADSPFELLECTPAVLADPFWPAYEQTHDAQAFAQSYTTFFRAFSEPCLFGQTNTPVAGEFYNGVQQRIAADPAAAVCHWQLLLMRMRRR
jgi:SAM dependent carboxyl methyltransferase